LNLQNVALHSPIKATVTFFDPRGKGTEVPLTLCPSYELFQKFLGTYYLVGTSTPIRGAKYVESRQYQLTFGGEDIVEGAEQTWSTVLKKGGPLEMYITGTVLDKSRAGFPFVTGRCSRCNALLPASSKSGRHDCLHCDLDLSVNAASDHDSNTQESGDIQRDDFLYFCKFRVHAVGDAELNGEMDPENRDDSLSKEAQNPIIHGDLKSVNILIDLKGRPSVVDFGVSLYTAMAAEAASMI